ncbi:MAG: hypothetical protein R2795_07400 [Saprospiraceae bacterium]
MEKELEAQTAYANNFRNLLLGKYQSVLEAQENIDSTDLAALENIEEVNLSPEEIQFRRELELEALGEAAALPLPYCRQQGDTLRTVTVGAACTWRNSRCI